LDGGREGLEIYDRFFEEVPNRLESGAAIFIEIGINQGDLVKNLVSKYLSAAKCEILGDLAGIDRVGIITVN
jgi:release factor glutamine methyltransferase